MGLVLAAIQQLTGINIVIYYAPMVFKTQGESMAQVLSLVMSLVNFIFTFGSLFCADRKAAFGSGRSGQEDFACVWVHRLWSGTACVHAGLWGWGGRRGTELDLQHCDLLLHRSL